MVRIRPSRAEDFADLLDIWRRSVRATHHFLAEKDFVEIEALVATSYLPSNTVWVAVNEAGRPLGFMGLSQAHIDTLFVDPDMRGQGVGTLLIDHAQERADTLTVDVNEQNDQAVGFYQHHGFCRIGRSDVDGDGRSYPLLHLKRAG